MISAMTDWIASAKSNEQPAASGGADRCPACGGALIPEKLRGHDRMVGTPGEHTVSVCAICGTGATRPLVGEDGLGQFYPSDYAPYVRRTGADRSMIRRLVANAIETFLDRRFWRAFPMSQVRDNPSGDVLDVGCGRGDLLGEFAAKGWRASGLEPSVDACQAARDLGLEVRQGTLGSVDVQPGSQDVVVFQHSLEHVPDPPFALARTAEILRPDGRILISVPNFGCWQRRMFGSNWFHLDLPRHRTHFTSAGLERALCDAGFEQVETRTSSSAVGLVYSIHYRLFGHWPYKPGILAELVPLVSLAAYPFAYALDRLLGGGDFLHAIARRRDDHA